MQRYRERVRVRVRRIVAADQVLSCYSPPDYVDAFEMIAEGADARSAEHWARSALELGPPRAVVRVAWLVHRYVLGFHLAPLTTPGHLLGWRVVKSDPSLVILEAKGPLMGGHMVWRVDEGRLQLTTFLHYERAKTAAAVWAVVGHLHRASPRLIGSAAARVPGSG